MTLYARGYRPFEGDKRARRLRFLPILREGLAQTYRTKAFWILVALSGFLFLVSAVMLYLGEGMFGGTSARGALDASESESFARTALLKGLYQVSLGTSTLGMVLTLFVGSGLVADDLRARALPLYLVRPIVPADYYLGKLLIPVVALSYVMLFPLLALVVLAAAFRPSERMFPFLVEQRDVLLAILAQYAAAALSFSSLALLASTWVGRRAGAFVLGGAVLFGSHIPSGLGRHVGGLLGDALQATSLQNDVAALYLSIADPDARALRFLPGAGPATAAVAAVTLLAAWTVLRRARSVEVVA